MQNKVALAMMLLGLALAGCNTQSRDSDKILAAPQGGRPLSTTLSGAAEVQPGDPDGSGTVYITLNPGLGEVCYQLEVSGIAVATAAHIHEAPVGQAGPVVVGLGAPSGGSSSGCVSLSPKEILEIIRHPEDYYVNVHNAEFPAGALRGQLSK